MSWRTLSRAVIPACASVLGTLVFVGGTAARPAATVAAHISPDACGVPVGGLRWIDYGEASVDPDVRAVLAQPGVIVSTSGTAVPAAFRSHGTATTYWVMHLDRIVGEPATPADPATISGAAATLLAQAQTSSACATPWIALNELLGSGARPPWSATTTQYRANVLELVQRLKAGGAHPALLLHGDPYVGGTAADWWRQVGASATLVYEAYYDASHIYPMGPVMGNRRMRMGVEHVVSMFEGAGLKPSQLGIMLGFHTALTPGIAGRQGLQPPEAWFRVVKWEALAARQVAQDLELSSVWSWGWGTFGPESVDPDKAAAACAYLWTRDANLCNAPQMVGPAFNRSLVEGQIVLPQGVACTFAGSGRVAQAAVDRLAAMTGDTQEALTAQFARAAMSRLAGVTEMQVLAFERSLIARSFHGSMTAYIGALARRHATLEIARGVIGDELRRRALAAKLAESGATQTTFETTIAYESKLVTTAICAGDVLPGGGNFPASDDRDVGVVPLPTLLPFLLRDGTTPATPAVPAAVPGAKGVMLTWPSGREPDLDGYDIYQSLDGGQFAKLNPAVVSALDYLAPTLAAGHTASYAVRAVDTSGNRSAPSPIATVTAG
jgi:hypothetical protein